jgi:tetratricopeptide (TPR) repeat protein
MVLCVEGDGIPPGFMLEAINPGLEKLRDACRASTSAEKVISDCGVAQEQLQVMLASEAAANVQSSPSLKERRGFLENAALGPERLGVLRTFVQLGLVSSPNGSAAQSGGGGSKAVRAGHHRVPLASSSPTESMALWTEFLRCAIGKEIPLLFISRAGADWLEVIIGEPKVSDFICLQAIREKFPLASECPYEVPAEVRSRLQAVEMSFLAAPPTTWVSPSTILKTPGVTPIPLNTRSSKRKIPLLIGVVAVIIGVLGIVIWSSRGHRVRALSPIPPVIPQSNPATSAPPAIAAASPPPSVAKADESASVEKFKTALTEARAAWTNNDFSLAEARATSALQLKAGDPDATKLQVEAHAALATMAAQKERNYGTALNDSSTFIQQKKYAEAIQAATKALLIKTNDPAALKLIERAQEGIADEARAQQRQKDYLSKLAAARAAGIDGTNFSGALSILETALALKAGDAEATNLISQVRQRAQRAQQVEQDFAKAMETARTAEKAGNFTNALAGYQAALKVKPGDPFAAAAVTNATPKAADQVRSIEEQAKKADDAKQAEQKKQTLSKLDSDLEILSVKFEIIKAKAATTEKGKGTKVLPRGLGEKSGDFYQKLVDDLEKSYKTGGWLDHEQRAETIKKLRNRIKTWDY